MDGELRGRQCEDRPAAAGIDRIQAQHILQERSELVWMLGVDQPVYTGDHGLSIGFRVQNQPGMSATKLIGRDAELAQLDAALDEATEHGSALFVTGAAGIGKTALLDAAATSARSRGNKVLTVTGLESEADLPYAGLHQLLQAVLSAARAPSCPPENAFLTAWGMRAGSPPEVFLVALATLSLLDEVADERPLVVLADDFQWLDDATSTVLRFVARRLESTHVLVIAGLRDTFQAAFRSWHLPEIHVEPLSDTASADLLGSVPPDPDLQTPPLI